MRKYGIAETFTSLQGEGLYTGTRMHFIRFSGCSVGKKLSDPERESFIALENPSHDYNGAKLPVYREKCTLYDGREFLCDTNFQTARVMTAEELVAEIPERVKRICLTGGEPLDRDLNELFQLLDDEKHFLHIETSGTVDIKKSIPGFLMTDGWVWLTVSPKSNVRRDMIDIANEIKLLVDASFDIDRVPTGVLAHQLVWVQPVNYEWDVNQENVQRCLKLIERFPNWRMSMQAHKIWKVR